jgi:MATE family multidrug resistance protein
VCIFGMGLLLGLDTLVSHAFGASRVDDCHRWLQHGVALSLL